MNFSAECNIELPGINDVLRTNIQGEDCSAVIKRWWYDQFLANPHDARCQNFYLSAHGIHRARYIQYTSYRNSIHPYSKFRYYWEVLMLSLWVFRKIFIIINLSSVFSHNMRSLYYAVAVAEVICLFDMYVNMRTCYIDTDIRQVVMDETKIVVRYLMYNLFYDASMSVPVQCIFLMRYCNVNLLVSTLRTNWFVCTLQFYNSMTLIRLFELTKIFKYERKRYWVRVIFSQLRIVMINFFTMFYLFSVTRTVCLVIVLLSNHVDPHSYHGHLYSYVTNNHMNDSSYSAIDRIIRFVLTRTFLVYFYYRKHVITEFGFIVIAEVVKNFFGLWLMADQYIYITALDYVKETKTKLKTNAIDMLKRSHVSNKISEKVRIYHEDPQIRPYFTECTNGLYTNLLDSLKNEIKLHRYSRIGRIKYFRRWPDDILIEFILLFKEDTYFSGDTVSQSHKPLDGFMVVDKGVLTVYSDDDLCTGHLIDNDFYGILSLVTDRDINVSYVVALTHCTILTLDKYVFRKFMRKYPNLFFELKHRLLLEYPTKHLHDVGDDEVESNIVM